MEPLRFLRLLVATVAPLSGLRGQTGAEHLAEARTLMNAKEWRAAADVLRGCAVEALSVAQREEAAACLAEIGEHQREAAALDQALAAHQAALDLLRTVHGDADDVKVAAALENVAYAQFSLGGIEAALAGVERALAMYRRIHGAAPHPDVAECLDGTGSCLMAMGRLDDARPRFEAALAMRRRLAVTEDDAAVALSLNNVASCLQNLGRPADALPLLQEVLASRRRRHGEIDDVRVALSMNNVACCLTDLGRFEEAAALHRDTVAMRSRLFAQGSHPDLAFSHSNLASALDSLGRSREALVEREQALSIAKAVFGEHDHPLLGDCLKGIGYTLLQLERLDEALPYLEASLAMRLRLYGGRDHPSVADSYDGIAYCLLQQGRFEAALTATQSALAMDTRLLRGRDHPDLADHMNGSAQCLIALGRLDEALTLLDEVLAMRRRIFGSADNPAIAHAANDLALCLWSLGRADEACGQFEAVVAMWQRLLPDQDHPSLAVALGNVVLCLQSMGRAADALPRTELVVDMHRRLHGDADHPQVAAALNTRALCLEGVGRFADALAVHRAAAAMMGRCVGGRDHVRIAISKNSVARCLLALGSATEARVANDEALAILGRAFGATDHPVAITCHLTRARCAHAVGRATEAIEALSLAAAMAERERHSLRLSRQLSDAYWDELKSGLFDELQCRLVEAGRDTEAFAALERSRSRELLDLLAQQAVDPLALVARAAGPDASRAAALRDELATLVAAHDRAMRESLELDAPVIDDPTHGEARRVELGERQRLLAQRLRQLEDEKARLIAGIVPVGEVRTTSEIQAVLRPGEVLLAFAITPAATLVYTVPPAGPAVVRSIPLAAAELAARVATMMRSVSRLPAADTARGRDPDDGVGARSGNAAAKALFDTLFPGDSWQAIQRCERVWVSAQGPLHRVPFDALVVSTDGDRVRYWLDDGPAVACVPSGSTLHWLRTRSRTGRQLPLDLLAFGDPRDEEPPPEVPERGVLVTEVADDGEAARVGIARGDVLLAYGDVDLDDDRSLAAARAALQTALGADELVPVRGWREGRSVEWRVRPGRLGIQVGAGGARRAAAASATIAERIATELRNGEAARLAGLPALPGARREVEAIAALAAAGRPERVRVLLGTAAREATAYESAPTARCLHFACHGIAEEYAGQSRSMLVLARPRTALAGDDGLLRLDDLLHRWQGRLLDCELVVLSACRTSEGHQLRDSSPQALPIGFLYAGATAVVSTLWRVDDRSTEILMTEFYRLRQTGQDHWQALRSAKRAVRQANADPFHWAPFLGTGLER